MKISDLKNFLLSHNFVWVGTYKKNDAFYCDVYFNPTISQPNVYAIIPWRESAHLEKYCSMLTGGKCIEKLNDFVEDIDLANLSIIGNTLTITRSITFNPKLP